MVDTQNSEPDEMGLVSRSIRLRFQIERNPSREDAIELRCESSLPGVPLPPQETVRSVAVRPNQPQVINNQKLHWYSYSSASRAVDALWLVWFLSGVRWVVGAGLRYVNTGEER